MIATCACGGSPAYVQDGVAKCPVCVTPEYTNLDYDCIPSSLPVLEIKAIGHPFRSRRRKRPGLLASPTTAVRPVWRRPGGLREPISQTMRTLQKPKRSL